MDRDQADIQRPASNPTSRREALRTIATVGVAGAIAPRSLATESAPLADAMARRKSYLSCIKQTAIDDYRRSHSATGGQLASDPNRLLAPTPKGTPWDYEVAIIGSGYGGSICAARLAVKLRPGQRLCLLERGREWTPGTFPDVLKETTGESQRPLLIGNTLGENNPLGLINLLRGKDISVMSGSGLGGTSLINANVALRPDRDVFQQDAWPIALRDRDFLEPYFAMAERELGIAREPMDLTAKMRAQRYAAERLADYGAHFEASALAVTRGAYIGLPIVNRQGVIQRPCINCGDCTTGCNVGAKNTLAMNYLPLARKHGAEVFTQTKVNHIEKRGDHYAVHFTHFIPCGDDVRCVHGQVTARILILSAGSLGSTELLLRSQSPNMQFSTCLGKNWTGNGDILGIVHRTCVETNIAGYGAYDPAGRSVGPTIQSNINFPHRPWHQRILIQEGSVARSYVNAMMFLGRDLDLSQTQVLLLMGHDGSNGRIELDERGQAVIRWPGYYDSSYRKFATDEINRTAAALGGYYQEALAFKGQAATVHPLGGCSLANDPNQGVLNHKGQVFDFAYGGSTNNDGSLRVHEGLYVCDGASLPMSVGVNPYLTIAGIAERTAHLITREPRYADIFVQ